MEEVGKRAGGWKGGREGERERWRSEKGWEEYSYNTLSPSCL